MRDLHVAAHVEQQATSGCTQEIDQQLFLAAQAVVGAMLPEPAKPGVAISRGRRSSATAEIAS
jgi:hypothetical protein